MSKIPLYTQTTHDWHCNKNQPNKPYAVDLNVGTNEYIFGRVTPDNKFIVTTGLVKDPKPYGIKMVGGKKKNKKGGNVSDSFKTDLSVYNENNYRNNELIYNALSKINQLQGLNSPCKNSMIDAQNNISGGAKKKSVKKPKTKKSSIKKKSSKKIGGNDQGKINCEEILSEYKEYNNSKKYNDRVKSFISGLIYLANMFENSEKNLNDRFSFSENKMYKTFLKNNNQVDYESILNFIKDMSHGSCGMFSKNADCEKDKLCAYKKLYNAVQNYNSKASNSDKNRLIAYLGQKTSSHSEKHKSFGGKKTTTKKPTTKKTTIKKPLKKTITKKPTTKKTTTKKPLKKTITKKPLKKTTTKKPTKKPKKIVKK